MMLGALLGTIAGLIVAVAITVFFDLDSGWAFATGLICGNIGSALGMFLAEY